MTKKTLTRLPAIACPHCEAKSIVRDSIEITPMVRELRLSCTNEDCGHTFVAQFSVIRTIRPSAMPKEGIRLPFGAWFRKSANDDHPEPANDDHGLAAAIASTMII
ncbi:ogr/Delta-like zinc finger family protein [Sphingomonas hylomeconis]|uniref:Ogr/Delta-like zinc finger family protein n=1 Tax=Sphingomonas hylomeconis TaxID=1395958 RepID=A0ABV7STL1_9SPHN|nr:ogr/Delta-like zinc finger family protein [Sphingomonas hylomeconis]